jgi:hypothetical protein
MIKSPSHKVDYDFSCWQGGTFFRCRHHRQPLLAYTISYNNRIDTVKLSPGVKHRRLKQPVHFHLFPSLRMSIEESPLPLYAFMLWCLIIAQQKTLPLPDVEM